VTTDLAKRACIFCNGELKNTMRVKNIANNCDLLIAADGGARHLIDIGLLPEIIIGDMDSIDAGILNDKGDIMLIPHSPDKDKSDAELALEYALEQRCEQVILVAAIGGRLDHTLGNVALVARYPGRIAIFDGVSTLVAVDKSEKCILHGQVGTPVSLIPYGSCPFSVRTKGLKYSLGDESLHSATHGLSNELSLTEACVCVLNGILLVHIENEDISFEAHQESHEANKRK